jgi:hypothetical protein
MSPASSRRGVQSAAALVQFSNTLEQRAANGYMLLAVAFGVLCDCECASKPAMHVQAHPPSCMDDTSRQASSAAAEVQAECTG